MNRKLRIIKLLRNLRSANSNLVYLIINLPKDLLH